ncbi:hypothetical protein [Maritimibacter sp. DP1N21-5]|uniref:hypothetical protein n=1 Tax=Maritimibacter sp. DP1N21-5 TaxID=2836867 RepID=UPI001C45696D|nr:hypothetical protein [Maritimibacter sp. DP1N21-5]MBV7410239.1 hypothetical protein [Maritimibacter sp. DP1N21-5]
MTPETIEALFQHGGHYHFARWGRPIVPVVFGVEDATLSVVKGALEAVVGLAGHKMADHDPELGANCMIFFFTEWSELLGVPNLGAMIPDLEALVARLQKVGATQYRAFRFDDAGAIQAAFVFVRMGGGLEEMSAETVALGQAVQLVLDWGEGAFAERSPLALHPEGGAVILRPEIAAVIRAAYDPVMPAAARDVSHAHRLAARVAL